MVNASVVDIVCRVALVVAIFLGVYYRDICFGKACQIGRDYTGYSMRVLAALVGFTGWISPVAGVILTCLFVFILVEVNYGKQWRASAIERSSKVESVAKAASYAASGKGRKQSRDAGTKNRVSKVRIEKI